MRPVMMYLLAGALSVSACSGANTSAAASAGPASDPAAAGNDSSRASKSSDVREVTIPAGTHLPIVLETAVASDTSRVEDPVRAHLARGVQVNGATVLPEGSRLSGTVTDATRSGRVKGRAHVAFRFDTLVPAGQDERYRIDTSAVGRMAPSTKKKDALEIGGGAAGGALIGGLIGGGKGALIGTAAGGGAGTAVVLSTRGKEIRLARGAALTLKLVKPVTVKVKG